MSRDQVMTSIWTRCKICVKNYYFCHFHDTLPVLYDFFMQKICLSKITFLVCKLHFWSVNYIFGSVNYILKHVSNKSRRVFFITELL